MAVKTATFNGRKHKIDFAGRLDGWCDQFKLDDRHIIIMAKENTQNELVTIIHECLHASNWHASEGSVDRTSTEIGRLLWRLGYRKQGD
jgi:hypothetical protein